MSKSSFPFSTNSTEYSAYRTICEFHAGLPWRSDPLAENAEYFPRRQVELIPMPLIVGAISLRKGLELTAAKEDAECAVAALERIGLVQRLPSSTVECPTGCWSLPDGSAVYIATKGEYIKFPETDINACSLESSIDHMNARTLIREYVLATIDREANSNAYAFAAGEGYPLNSILLTNQPAGSCNNAQASRTSQSIPREIIQMGRAAKLVELIQHEETEHQGRSLTDMLRDANTTHTTFQNSRHFKEARYVYKRLKEARDAEGARRKHSRALYTD